MRLLPHDRPVQGAGILHPRSVALLNAHFSTHSATALLEYALSGALGRTALVSSFGAEAAVLLHMTAIIAADTPVLFLDTEMHFPETLTYQHRLAARLGLTDLRRITPGDLPQDPDGLLHGHDPQLCCTLRKTLPLAGALAGFDGWITGRKRVQSGIRAAMPVAEQDHTGRIKLNPLAGWTRHDFAQYFDTHDLPRHPLVARGFPSIGCAPCTTSTTPDEDPRAGRWRGRDRLECGIHLPPVPPEGPPS